MGKISDVSYENVLISNQYYPKIVIKLLRYLHMSFVWKISAKDNGAHMLEYNNSRSDSEWNINISPIVWKGSVYYQLYVIDHLQQLNIFVEKYIPNIYINYRIVLISFNNDAFLNPWYLAINITKTSFFFYWNIL